MNHIFNVKFNQKTGKYQAVGEHVSLNGKGSRGAKALIAAMVGTLSLYTMAAGPGALPTGGTVVNGAAAITSTAGNMLIKQSSTNATINWTRYNVGAEQTVTYQTPSSSSITMNRISGGSNVIEGAVTSNGSLWFATPGGSLSVMNGGKVQSMGGEVYITTQDLKAGVYEKAKDLATVGSGTVNVNKGQLFGSNITIDAGAVNLENATLTAGNAAAPGQVVVKGAGNIRIAQSAITAEGGSIAIGREAYAEGGLSSSTAVTDSTLKAVQIETSGAQLSTSGNTVSAQEWLLDPTNMTIAATATAPSVLTASSAASAATGAVTVTPTDIQNAMNAGTSVTLAGTGTITQSSALTFNITATGKTPTLKLDNTTGVKQNITLSTMTDNTTASGSGVSLQVLSAGGTITSGGAINLKGSVSIDNSNNGGVSAASANTAGLAINASITAAGAISLKGVSTTGIAVSAATGTTLQAGSGITINATGTTAATVSTVDILKVTGAGANISVTGNDTAAGATLGVDVGAVTLSSGSSLTLTSNNKITQTGAIAATANTNGAVANIVFDTTSGTSGSAVSLGSVTVSAATSTSDINVLMKSKGAAISAGAMGTSLIGLPGTVTIDNTYGASSGVSASGYITAANMSTLATTATGVSLSGAIYSAKAVALKGVSYSANQGVTTATVISASSGDITINGITNTGNSVYFSGANADVTAASGNVNISGVQVAGNTAIYLNGNNLTSTLGSINLDATGTTGTYALYSTGALTAKTAINITGTGSTNPVALNATTLTTTGAGASISVTGNLSTAGAGAGIASSGTIAAASGTNISFTSKNTISQTGALNLTSNTSGLPSSVSFDTTSGTNASSITTGNLSITTGSTSDINLSIKSKGAAINPGTIGTSSIVLPGTLTLDNTHGGTVTAANAVAGIGLTLNGAMYANKGISLSGVSSNNNAIQTSAAVSSANGDITISALGTTAITYYGSAAAGTLTATNGAVNLTSTSTTGSAINIATGATITAKTGITVNASSTTAATVATMDVLTVTGAGANISVTGNDTAAGANLGVDVGNVNLASGSNLTLISNNKITQTGIIANATNTSGVASNIVFDGTTGTKTSTLTVGSITVASALSTSDINLRLRSNGSAIDAGTVGTSTNALPGTVTIDNTNLGAINANNLLASAVAGVGLTLDGAIYTNKSISISGVSNANTAVNQSAVINSAGASVANGTVTITGTTNTGSGIVATALISGKSLSITGNAAGTGTAANLGALTVWGSGADLVVVGNNSNQSGTGISQTGAIASNTVGGSITFKSNNNINQTGAITMVSNSGTTAGAVTYDVTTGNNTSSIVAGGLTITGTNTGPIDYKLLSSGSVLNPGAISVPGTITIDNTYGAATSAATPVSGFIGASNLSLATTSSAIVLDSGQNLSGTKGIVIKGVSNGGTNTAGVFARGNLTSSTGSIDISAVTLGGQALTNVTPGVVWNTVTYSAPLGSITLTGTTGTVGYGVDLYAYATVSAKAITITGNASGTGVATRLSTLNVLAGGTDLLVIGNNSNQAGTGISIDGYGTISNAANGGSITFKSNNNINQTTAITMAANTSGRANALTYDVTTGTSASTVVGGNLTLTAGSTSPVNYNLLAAGAHLDGGAISVPGTITLDNTYGGTAGVGGAPTSGFIKATNISNAIATEGITINNAMTGGTGIVIKGVSSGASAINTTLTLTATTGDLNISGISGSSTGYAGSGSLVATAGNVIMNGQSNTGSAINFSSTVTANAGNVTITGSSASTGNTWGTYASGLISAKNITITGTNNTTGTLTAGGAVYLGALTIVTGGGNLLVTGNNSNQLSNGIYQTGTITDNANGGNILFKSNNNISQNGNIALAKNTSGVASSVTYDMAAGNKTATLVAGNLTVAASSTSGIDYNVYTSGATINPGAVSVPGVITLDNTFGRAVGASTDPVSGFLNASTISSSLVTSSDGVTVNNTLTGNGGVVLKSVSFGGSAVTGSSAITSTLGTIDVTGTTNNGTGVYLTGLLKAKGVSLTGTRTASSNSNSVRQSAIEILALTASEIAAGVLGNVTVTGNSADQVGNGVYADGNITQNAIGGSVTYKSNNNINHTGTIAMVANTSGHSNAVTFDVSTGNKSSTIATGNLSLTAGSTSNVNFNQYASGATINPGAISVPGVITLDNTFGRATGATTDPVSAYLNAGTITTALVTSSDGLTINNTLSGTAGVVLKGVSFGGGAVSGSSAVTSTLGTIDVTGVANTGNGVNLTGLLKAKGVSLVGTRTASSSNSSVRQGAIEVLALTPTELAAGVLGNVTVTGNSFDQAGYGVNAYGAITDNANGSSITFKSNNNIVHSGNISMVANTSGHASAVTYDVSTGNKSSTISTGALSIAAGSTSNINFNEYAAGATINPAAISVPGVITMDNTWGGTAGAGGAPTSGYLLQAANFTTALIASGNGLQVDNTLSGTAGVVLKGVSYAGNAVVGAASVTSTGGVVDVTGVSNTANAVWLTGSITAKGVNETGTRRSSSGNTSVRVGPITVLALTSAEAAAGVMGNVTITGYSADQLGNGVYQYSNIVSNANGGSVTLKSNNNVYQVGNISMVANTSGHSSAITYDVTLGNKSSSITTTNSTIAAGSTSGIDYNMLASGAQLNPGVIRVPGVITLDNTFGRDAGATTDPASGYINASNLTNLATSSIPVDINSGNPLSGDRGVVINAVATTGTGGQAVRLLDSVTSSAGNVSISGTTSAGSGIGNYIYGCCTYNAPISAPLGTVTLTGTVTGDGVFGVRMLGSDAGLITAKAITVTGTIGGIANSAVYLDRMVIVAGGGDINITGNTATQSGNGIMQVGTITDNASGGNITFKSNNNITQNGLITLVANTSGRQSAVTYDVSTGNKLSTVNISTPLSIASGSTSRIDYNMYASGAVLNAGNLPTIPGVLTIDNTFGAATSSATPVSGYITTSNIALATTSNAVVINAGQPLNATYGVVIKAASNGNAGSKAVQLSENVTSTLGGVSITGAAGLGYAVYEPSATYAINGQSITILGTNLGSSTTTPVYLGKLNVLSGTGDLSVTGNKSVAGGGNGIVQNGVITSLSNGGNMLFASNNMITQNGTISLVANTSGHAANIEYNTTTGNKLSIINPGVVTFNGTSTSDINYKNLASGAEIIVNSAMNVPGSITLDNTWLNGASGGITEANAANYATGINGVALSVNLTAAHGLFIKGATGSSLTTYKGVNITGGTYTSSGVFNGGQDAINITGVSSGVTANQSAVSITGTVSILNNSTLGNTNLIAYGGRYYDPVVITNASSAGAVAISAIGPNASVVATNASTITQNSNAGVFITSSENGNVTPPKIINNGTGPVAIAAGADLPVGIATGGQIVGLSGNTITSPNGNVYLYAGLPTNVPNLTSQTSTNTLAYLAPSLGTLTFDNTLFAKAYAAGNVAASSLPITTLAGINTSALATALPTTNTTTSGTQGPVIQFRAVAQANMLLTDNFTKMYGTADPSTAYNSVNVAGSLEYQLNRNLIKSSIANPGFSVQGGVEYFAVLVNGMQFKLRMSDFLNTVTATRAQFGTLSGEQVTSPSTPYAYSLTSAHGVLIAAGVDLTLSGNSNKAPYLGLEITPAPLTLSPTALTKVYGDSITPTGNAAQASGVINGVTVDGVTINDVITNFALSSSGFASSANVGSYTVTPGAITFAAGASSNYSITNNTTSVAVTRAPLTVTANAATKYEGMTDPTGFRGVSYSGFVNGDAAASLGASTGISVTRSNSSVNGVGVYSNALTAAGPALLGNYALTYAPGTFTIAALAPNTLAVLANGSTVYGATGTAPLLASVVYKDSSNVLHTLTPTSATGTASLGSYVYTDGANGTVSFSVAPSVGNSSLSSAGKPKVGDYAVVQSGVMTTTIAQLSTSMLVAGGETVTPASASVSATPTLLTYNASTQSQSAYVASGFLSSDAIGISAAQVTGRNAGTYNSNIALSSSNANNDLANYSVAINNAALTINPAALSLSNVGAVSKVYNGNTAAVLNMGSATLSGVLSTDSVSFVATALSAQYANKNVGTSALTLAGGNAALTGVDAANYILTGLNNYSGVITPAPLTLIGVGTTSKVYDTNTTATLNVGSAVLGGVLPGDTVTFNANALSATYDTKNVGVGKVLTVLAGAGTLTGSDASNYSISNLTSFTGSITPAPLALAGSGATTKVYDGTTNASVNTSAITLTGVLGGDVVSLNASGMLASYDNKNVGASKAVLITAAPSALSGADAGNYEMTGTLSIAGSITPAPLTLTGLSGVSRTYNATNAATLDTTNATLTGLVAGDTVSISTTGVSGTFADKNVGLAKPITVTGASALSGADAANYALQQISGVTGDITPLALSLAGIGQSSKVYDATTAATLNLGGANLTGVLAGDTVSLNTSGISAAYADKNVGSSKPLTVSVTGNGLVGTDATNYTLQAISGITGNITPVALTLSGVGATSKVYDGTTTASLNVSAATLNGVLTGDTVTFSASGLTSTYADKNVGSGKILSVTAGNTALSGADGGNYVLTGLGNYTGAITPATLTLGNLGATTKVYDGNTYAALDLSNATLTGVVQGDAVQLNSVGLTATYNTKDVGVGKALSVASGAGTLSGADSANYVLSGTSGLTGTITPAPLTITANNNGKFTGQADSVGYIDNTIGYAGVAYSGFVAAETSADLGSNPGIAVTRNNSSVNAPATYTGALIAAGPATLGNYAITYAPGNYTITGYNTMALQVSSGATQVYGTAGTAPSIASVQYMDNSNTLHTLTQQSVSGSGAATTYTYVEGAGSVNFTLVPTGTTASTSNSVKVGTYALAMSGAVTVSNIPNLLTTANVSGNLVVTKADASVRATPTSVVYNAGNQTQSAPILSGFVAGDAITIADAQVTARNVGTYASNVVVSSGNAQNDLDNYNLTVTNANLVIRPAPLTLNTAGAITRVYNGTTSAALNSNSTISGVLGNDMVTFSAAAMSAAFVDKNVGNQKALTVSAGTGALTGADASNYSFTNLTNLTGSITPAQLTLSRVSVATKVYDRSTTATLDAGSAAVVGVIPGDAVTLTASGLSAAFVDKNVGAGKAMNVTATNALGGADAQNYTLTGLNTLTGTITPAGLTLSGVGTTTKVYDSTVSASLNAAGASLSGVISGDTVSLDASALSSSFADKHVGTSKNLNVSAGAGVLSGSDASNYTLTGLNTFTGSITPAPLTLSGMGSFNKVYDASLNAPVNAGNARLLGVIGSDAVDLNVSSFTATYANKNIGAGKSVVVNANSGALGGADAGNYTLTGLNNYTGTITPAPLSLSVSGTNSKVYDGNLNAALGAGLGLTGVFANDVVNVSAAELTVAYLDKNVGSNKGLQVVATANALTGADASNYTLVNLNNLTGNITPKALSLSGLGVAAKVYDGNTFATLNLASTALSGVVVGDSIAVNTSALSANFADKNVGNYKAVTVSTGAGSLSGTDAGNYTLSAITGLTGTITPASLVISNAGAVNKVYDGTTSAVLNTADASLSGLVAGDVVSLNANGLVSSFLDKHVGTGKSLNVTLGSTPLTGADAGNYVLSGLGIFTGNITPAPLTLSNVGTSAKVYDGNTVAALNVSNASLNGVIAGDAVVVDTAGLSASYNNANVGTNKALTLTAASTTLSGADAANYTLTGLNAFTGSITPAPLLVTANSNGKFAGQSDAAGYAGVTYVGLVNGETATSALGVNPAITVSRAGQGSVEVAGTYANALTASGPATLGNYALSFAPGNFTINAVNQLSIQLASGTANSVMYGTAGAAPTIASMSYADTNGTVHTFTQQSVTGNASSAQYTFVESGTGATVSFTLKPLTTVQSGALKVPVGNYTLSSTNLSVTGVSNLSTSLSVNGLLTVTPAVASVVATPTTLTYNGATQSQLAAVTSGFLSGDGITITGSQAVGKNAGTYASNLAISGSDVANYSVALTNANLIISPVQIASNGNASIGVPTLTATANHKVYNGNSQATGTLSLSGLFAGDVLTASSTSSTFADKNVGNAKAVTFAGLTLNGDPTTLANYSLDNIGPAMIATANITPAALTVVGVGVANKVYDATTSTGLNFNAGSLSGVIPGDTVNYNAGVLSASFADKHVGLNKQITVSGVVGALSGVDASNYVLTNLNSFTGNITAAPLTLSGVGLTTKVYDANTSATLNAGNASLVGALAQDAVSFAPSELSASFADKNVGTSKALTVTAGAAALTGVDAANYTLTGLNAFTGSITPKAVVLSVPGNTSKVYDGTTNATLSNTGSSVSGLIAGDAVAWNVNGLTLSYADKNAGTAKVLNVAAGNSLSGADAGNYTLTGLTGITGSITPKDVSLVMPGATSKVYDGNTVAALNLSGATLNGVIAGDALALNSIGLSANYANANVGAAKAITVSIANNALTGTDAGNYTLTGLNALTGSIAPAPLLVNANNSGKFIQQTDPTNYAGLGYLGFVNGESVAALGASPAINITRPGMGSVETAGVYTGALVATGPANLGNYALTYAPGTFTITPQNKVALQITGGATQVYGSTGTGPSIATVAYLDSNNVVQTLTPRSVSGSGASTVYTYQDTNGGTVSFALTPTGTVTSNSGNTAVGNYSLALSGGLTITNINNLVGTADVSGNLLVTKANASAVAAPTTVTYNGATQTQLANRTGFLSNDLITVTGAASSINAGTYASNLLVGGSDIGNYSVVVTNANLVIKPYQLVPVNGAVSTGTPIITVTANSKVYDSSTTASGTLALTGLFGSDVLSISSNAPSFADKNVGTSKTVSFAGVSLSGNPSTLANYTLGNIGTTLTATANITPKAASVTATPTSLVYNGAQQFQSAALVTGFMAGDAIAVTGTQAQGQNAGTYGSNLLITGADVGNYAISTQNANLVITPYVIPANNPGASVAPGTPLLTATANSKVYDANTAATGSLLVSGLFGNDVLTASSISQTFADKNVGTAKTVTFSGVSLQGNASTLANYVLANSSSNLTATANITPAALHLSGLGTPTKVYDGSSSFTLNLAANALVGVLGNDVVNLPSTGLSAVFSDKNVGTNKSLTLTAPALALSGADFANYALTTPSNFTGSITPKAASVTATPATLTYNGTVQYQAATAAGFIAGDVFTVGGIASGRNAGTYTSSLVVNGMDASNYSITYNNSNLVINPYQIAPVVPGVTPPLGTPVLTATASNKVYDGSPAVSGLLSVSNLFAGDVLSVTSQAPAFADANVGNAKTVSFNGVSLQGNATTLANYVLSSSANQVTTTASITPASLQIIANSNGKFVGQADSTGVIDAAVGYAGVNYQGFVNGETAAVLGNSPGISVARLGVGSNEAAGTTYTGSLVPTGASVMGNYAVTYVPGNYTITPINKVAIQIANGGQQVYGASANNVAVASVAYEDTNNVIHNLSLQSVSRGLYTYADGAGNTVSFKLTPTGTVQSASGNTAVGNYALQVSDLTVNTSTGLANAVNVNGEMLVTKAQASVMATASTKTYNGAVQTQSAAVSSGFVSGDDVVISHAQAAGTNAGTYASNISVSGADVNNYALSLGNANLVINPYQIVPVAPGTNPSGQPTPGVVSLTATANNKVYNATTAAVGRLSLSGLFGTDTLTVISDAPTFADVNVGTAKTVTFSGVTLSGSASAMSNYTLGSMGSTLTATANITPAPVILSSAGITSKVYDGTTAAVLNTGSGTLSGVLGSDVVKFNSTGLTAVFNNKNVGTGKSLNVVAASNVLSGADASNYSLLGLDNFKGTITPYQISFVAPGASPVPGSPSLTALLDSKTYDGTVNASGRLLLSGLFGSDVISINSNAPTFSDANVGSNKPVTFDGLTLMGNPQVLANYTIGSLSGQVSMLASIAPMLPDATQTMVIAGLERFAGHVTFKAPVLEFVPLFLSSPNVEFKTDDQKTSSEKEKPASLVLNSIVERSVWSIDVSSEKSGAKSGASLKVSYKSGIQTSRPLF